MENQYNRTEVLHVAALIMSSYDLSNIHLSQIEQKIQESVGLAEKLVKEVDYRQQAFLKSL